MAEIASNVYDLIYPSPVALEEIASIAVSAQLWRLDINIYRENGTFANDVSLKEIIPGLPSVIHDNITKYIKVFGDSMFAWLGIHFEKIFGFHRDNENKILNDFDDFVCDWDGSIHYHRTAKRMMICDRLSNEEKFKIACLYCFEDDIKRVWPSVSGTIDVNDYVFNEYPQLCYWIYIMRNESHLIPNERREPIDEMMLFKFHYRHQSDWSSILYFWGRLTPEHQCQQVGNVYFRYSEFFIRFILLNLSEQLLSKFLVEQGRFIINDLVYNTSTRHPAFLAWMYIKDKIPGSAFIDIIEIIIKLEIRCCSDDDQTNFYCELWRSTPHNLKQSVLEKVLANNCLFEKKKTYCDIIGYRFPPRNVKFFLTMLSDATFDERSKFWFKSWPTVIKWTRNEDLYQIMKLCFQNEKDIAQFKETTLCKFENINEYCVELLEGAHFKEVDDFLNFCCSNIQTKITWKQHLLQVCFLGEHSVLTDSLVYEIKMLEDFISDAFESSDQVADFRNQFISSPQTEHRISDKSVRAGSFLSIMHFVSKFEPTDEILSRMKKSFVDAFKGWLEIGCIHKFDGEMVQTFLLWCLETEDQVTKLKQSMSAEQVFKSLVRQEAGSVVLSSNGTPAETLAYPRDLDEFLKWFFNSSEEIQEFKDQFTNIFKMLYTVSPSQGW